jgi:hypothetical protein
MEKRTERREQRGESNDEKKPKRDLTADFGHF